MYFVTFLDKSQFFSKTVQADAGTRLSHAKTKHKTSCGQIQSAAAGTISIGIFRPRTGQRQILFFRAGNGNQSR